jgi:hypothetical protein
MIRDEEFSRYWEELCAPVPPPKPCAVVGCPNLALPESIDGAYCAQHEAELRTMRYPFRGTDEEEN